MKPFEEFKTEKPKPYWMDLGNGSRLLIDPECPPSPSEISAAIELAKAVERTGAMTWSPHALRLGSNPSSIRSDDAYTRS
jgi:hypothetical protein